jgi:hypothetical protein
LDLKIKETLFITPMCATLPSFVSPLPLLHGPLRPGLSLRVAARASHHHTEGGRPCRVMAGAACAARYRRVCARYADRVILRRRSAAETAGAAGAAPTSEAGHAEAAEQPAAGGTAPPKRAPGKGRPTPKRSEAERRRRQPFAAPKDRKEATRQSRDRQRAARVRRMEAMRRGDEWALPARDRGPARALARDYVDSRRRLSEFYMYGLLVLMVLLFVRVPAVQQLVPLVVLAAVLVMIVEGVFLGYRVRALVQQRLPGESTRGVRMYAAMRALQIRRLRMPKPRVKPGTTV